MRNKKWKKTKREKINYDVKLSKSQKINGQFLSSEGFIIDSINPICKSLGLLSSLATFLDSSRIKCNKNDVQALNKKLTTLFSLLENFHDSTFTGVLENSATPNRDNIVFSGLDNYYKTSATPSIKKATGLNILTEMEFLFALGINPITLLNILLKHKRSLQAINSVTIVENVTIQK